MSYLHHHRHPVYDHPVPDVVGVHDEEEHEGLEGELGLVPEHEDSREEEGGEEDEEAVGVHSQNEQRNDSHHP